tara:strand:- start:208 stop:1356 length:1149 start_codon:yes stop_codon:yes gene_type:complete
MEHTIEMISPKNLIAYKNNSRTHSKEQINQIENSIKEFGFTNPVLLDKNNEIIAGHGRVLASKKMGIKEVPCLRLSHLTEQQKRAYVIADNQLALNAGWDENILSLEIGDLSDNNFDISLLGFNDLDLNNYLLKEFEGLTDEDEVPEPPIKPVTKLGDIWQLGNHRLMCGDSTMLDNIDKLTEKQKPDMIFTDPPYNVAFNGRSGKFDVIKNDNLEENEFNNFIDTILSNINILNINTYYICCNWAFYGILQKKLKPKACIVWAKNVFGLGKGYRHQHEFILFDGFIDASIKNESDLWKISKDTKYKHPTQKPVELSSRAIKNSSKMKNIILDIFGGSGSTLIACEKLNRKARIMELDPKYCDVIVKRWENFTGKKAELLNE